MQTQDDHTQTPGLRFGSVCSGIEAASVAWHPLGWKAAWLSEIEPFPSAVLAHHYPDVPNLGDMTTLPSRITSGEVEAPDLFCGGTPCQAFSVAGLRNSLDDARGNLSLTFCEIANAIDTARAGASKPAAIIFWENVPGVLSTKDNAFGCFLAGLAGEANPVEPPRGKWTNAGVVLGPQRAVAWRVLDAQYFGVAQRRRRVFVVASAREGFDPASVLLEFNGVRRDSAPSREAGKESADSTAAGAQFGGMSPVAGTLTANTGGMTRPAGNANELDFCVPVCPTLRAGGNSTGGDRPPGTDFDLDGGVIRQPVAARMVSFGEYVDDGTASAMKARDYKDATDLVAGPAYGIRTANTSSNGWGIQEEVTHTLDTTQGVAVAQPIAFHPTQDPICNHEAPIAAYQQPISIHPHCIGRAPEAGPQGKEYLLDGSAYCMDSRGQPQAVAFQDTADCLTAAYGTKWNGNASATNGSLFAAQSMAVRRLTPVECERLQGFPDGYTQIPWRKKPADECPDGPRYKALGNSWAVPVVRWIGSRIQARLSNPAAHIFLPDSKLSLHQQT